MNIELMRKWVEALRSGKYSQGYYTLKDTENNFCCLGVLCDITKDQLNLEWTLDTAWRYEIDGRRDVPPEKVLDLLGWDTNTEFIKASEIHKILSDWYGIENEMVSLIEMNDSYELSFTQIADVLEAKFLQEP